MLRGVFGAMFLTQAGVAALLAGALALLVSPRAPATALTSQVLVLLSLVQVPVAATIAYFTGRSGGKGAALAATIMAGVLLATPAWFLAFAVLIGSGGVYLALLLTVVVNAYAVGFILCGHFAGFAVAVPPVRADEADGLVEQA